MAGGLPGAPAREPLDARRGGVGAALALAACLPALLDPGVLARAAGIELGLPPLEDVAAWRTPWFPAGHALLLWLWAPCVVLSACFLFLLPGLVLARVLGQADELGRWVLCALGLSLVLVSAAAAALQAALGAPLEGRAFGATVLALAALLALPARARARAGKLPPSCLALAGERRLAATLVVVPWLLLAALAPKFHWESFNGDGVHAYEATRLLLSRALPFWDAGSGPIALYPGVTSMLFAFPGAWFLRLFGACEAAVRVPALLYLAGVFAGIAALAAQRRRLALGDAALVWLALATYFVVVAFSASYDPYSADIALPATQDTLLVACFLGFVLAWSRNERWWGLLFLGLAYVSLPSGLLLVLLFVAAAWLLERPRPWAKAAATAAGLAACVGLAALLPRALAALGLPLPGQEYESVLQRFAFLQATDVRRALFVLLPCGIAPALALFAWRGLDPLARALALVALGYFALFYVQAYVSLHHFVPAMLLPLCVLWRGAWTGDPRLRARVLPAAAVLGVLALVLVLPAHGGIAVHARALGQALEVRVPGYERSAPAAFACVGVLGELFPNGIEPGVPEQRFGGSPFTWNYYARRAERAPGSHGRPADYRVQPAADPAPEGMHPVASEQGFALFVRDLARWERQQALLLPFPPGSPLLAVDRGILFGQAPRGRKLFILNVRSFLRKTGLARR